MVVGGALVEAARVITESVKSSVPIDMFDATRREAVATVCG
jgi:hypothetical protein